MPTATATVEPPPALVATPTDTTSPVAGALVVESIYDLSAAISSGSWADAGLTGAVAAVDVAATVIDPIGTLIGSGLGWLIEHLEPLNGWLDDLAGDDDAVRAFAQTWHDVGGRLEGSADRLERGARADLEAMTGEAIEAYREHVHGTVDELRAIAASGRTVAGALETCSYVVGAVRDLVRDALAQAVGTAISAALGLGLSLGTAAPAVLAQVSARVASLVGRVASSLTRLVTSVRALVALVRQLEEALRAMARKATRLPAARARAHVLARAHSALGPARARATTRPSLPPRGSRTPGGTAARTARNMGAQRLAHEAENEAVHLLASLGWRVVQSPCVPGARNPDYLIEGEVFDAYAPTTASVGNVRKQICRKILEGQTARIVLILDQTPLKPAEVVEQLRTRPVDGLEELLIVFRGAVLSVEL